MKFFCSEMITNLCYKFENRKQIPYKYFTNTAISSHYYISLTLQTFSTMYGNTPFAYKALLQAMDWMTEVRSVYRLKQVFIALPNNLQSHPSIRDYYAKRLEELTESERRRPPTAKQIEFYRRLAAHPVFSPDESYDLFAQLQRLNFFSISLHLDAMLKEVRFRTKNL